MIKSNAVFERIAWDLRELVGSNATLCPMRFTVGSFIMMKGGFIMGKQIQWEASLTTAKARVKKEKKLILMDFYNNL